MNIFHFQTVWPLHSFGTSFYLASAGAGLALLAAIPQYNKVAAESIREKEKEQEKASEAELDPNSIDPTLL